MDAPSKTHPENGLVDLAQNLSSEMSSSAVRKPDENGARLWYLDRMANHLKPEERFLRLPDDPSGHDQVLEAARGLDPDARLHRCAAPTGTVLEVHNVQAMVFAKLTVSNLKPHKFKSTD